MELVGLIAIVFIGLILFGFLKRKGGNGKACQHEWEVDVAAAANSFLDLKCKKCGALNSSRRR